MTSNRKTSIRQTIADTAAEIVAVEGEFKFSRVELQAAFDMVADPNDWKCPVRAFFTTDTQATASERMVAAVRQAVIFYTGSVPTITHWGNFTFKCVADGYYRAVGA